MHAAEIAAQGNFPDAVSSTAIRLQGSPTSAGLEEAAAGGAGEPRTRGWAGLDEASAGWAAP
jgi:hypothetical protein